MHGGGPVGTPLLFCLLFCLLFSELPLPAIQDVFPKNGCNHVSSHPRSLYSSIRSQARKSSMFFADFLKYFCSSAERANFRAVANSGNSLAVAA